tara:strand:- start:28812 stop:29084 length:273 start_codon:yes stop_codon:yes gene_type:complete
MQTVEKPLKVGKTDIYNFQVSEAWLDGETLDTVIITVDTAKVTLNSQTIAGNTIFMSLTGVAIGDTEIHIDYTTATRTDCDGFILILEDC